MSETIGVSKVTCEIYKGILSGAINSLKTIGVSHVHVHSRRALVLREQQALPFLPVKTGLDEDPLEVIEFYIPKEKTKSVLQQFVSDTNLVQPGRGSVHSEEVEIINPSGISFRNAPVGNESNSSEVKLLSKLSGISCVLQRGRGNEIARHALESGTAVPTIGFGVGTGLRNKLGLLRITIPAEKEVVSLIVSEHDRDGIMNSLIEAGRLDQPGRGFISTYPITAGVVNSKTFRGKQRHGATMEQVISAIDHLRSGTEWRRRTENTQSSSVYLKKSFLTDLVNMTLICNEGKSGDLVNAAMAAGAGGATISKINYLNLVSNESSIVSPARESIVMGIAPASAQNIIESIRKIGAFESEATCVVEIKPLPKACTYLGK